MFIVLVGEIQLMELELFPSEAVHHLAIGENLTKLCFIDVQGEHCLSPELEAGVYWTIENKNGRSKASRQLTINNADSRVKANTSCCYDAETNQTRFESYLRIHEVGLDHQKSYVCKFRLFKYYDEIEFQIRVEAENKSCRYSDQCESRQCHQGKCKCSTKHNYAIDKDGCVPSKS